MTTLPAELILRIVNEAAYKRSGAIDYRTLYHLSLTSHAFLPFARDYLYRDANFIVVRNPSPGLITNHEGLLVADLEHSTMLDSRHSGSSLVGRPELQALVRFVRIDHDWPLRHMGNVKHQLADALSGCVNMRRLRVFGDGAPQVVDGVAEALLGVEAQLDCLSVPLVSYIDDKEAPVIRLLRAQRQLKSLTIEEVDLFRLRGEQDWLDCSTLPDLACSLVELKDLSYPRYLPPSGFRALTAGSAISLSRLTLHDATLAELDLSIFTNLVFLHIRRGEQYYTIPDTRRLHRVLSTCAGLRHLELAAYTVDVDIDFLLSRPATIEHLDLEQTCLSSASILRVLRSGNLPQVRYLCFAASQWAEEDIKDVRKLCEDKSIDLEMDVVI